MVVGHFSYEGPDGLSFEKKKKKKKKRSSQQMVSKQLILGLVKKSGKRKPRSFLRE
jgi:hypothetical protein